MENFYCNFSTNVGKHSIYTYILYTFFKFFLKNLRFEGKKKFFFLFSKNFLTNLDSNFDVITLEPRKNEYSTSFFFFLFSRENKTDTNFSMSKRSPMNSTCVARRDRAHTEYELAICYGIAFLRHFNLLILLPARHTQLLAPEITVL